MRQLALFLTHYKKGKGETQAMSSLEIWDLRGLRDISTRPNAFRNLQFTGVSSDARLEGEIVNVRFDGGALAPSKVTC